MASDLSFLRIPSNIKLQFAPFLVTPGGGMLKFSFKPSTIKGAGAKGLINMVPSSISRNTEMFTKDLSFKNQKTYTKFNDILDILPSIKIREYLPDTKLDQSLNFFSDMFTNILKGKGKKDVQDAGKDTLNTTQKSKDLKDKLTNVIEAVMKKIDEEGWMDTLTKGTEELEAAAHGCTSGKEGRSVLKVPYFLYYKLQSCRTTNVYELPCVPSNNSMYSSDGHPGWEGASGMRLLPDFAKNIPILGKMLDSLFGNMGINFTPWWDASKGSETKAPEIELKFSLFNDNIDAAVNNFVFVNTIIAHCRWIQYNILQHSSSLYDVSIAGIGKQYACMGSFDVLYKGTLRLPSSELINRLQSCVNSSKYNASLIANTYTIRIPDVYDVTMKFLSLLPLNFNTFVYNFVLPDIMNMAEEQQSGFNNLDKAIKDLIKTAENAWS